MSNELKKYMKQLEIRILKALVICCIVIITVVLIVGICYR
jgi:hypothetical protein